ncbi:MAG: DUF4388 domain-containing protein [Acidobacteria bacterium]|nr:MAG: DUF4388 domain-containing protein [Acidobacteriota bacterium]
MAATNLKGVASRVEWVGSLDAVPLAQVLRQIASEERSGDLQINLGSAIKSIYFDHGFVIFAGSNLKRDRLGESLIEAGRISRHEFALASILMKGSRHKFGQALVKAGVMSEEELGKHVAAQVNRIVMSLFKSPDAVYSFDERDTVIPMELMVGLSIYRILLEGVRHMTNGKLLLAGLPPLNTMVRVAERPPFTIDPRKLKPIEQSVLRSAGRGAPLSALLERGDSERGLVLRACYGLYAAGLLELADQNQRRPLKVQEETGVFVLSEIQRKFAKIQATNAQQEILMEFDRLDRASEKELLHLEGPAQESAIQKAFEDRQSEWKKKRAMVEAQQTLVAKIDVIQERLQKAYERMLEQRVHANEETEPDTAAVPTFETQTEQQLPPLNEELFEEMGIDVGSDNEETAYALVDTQPPEPSADEASTEESRERESDEDATPDVIRAGLLGAARADRVRQLLRDVKLHFQVRDWEHSVSLLYELVELEPDVAQHHGMLGRAMARHPVMRKDAERHFIEALRLAPQNADLHFSLGLYYKSFAMHSRAQNEFRTALRIRPKHEGARKQLSAGPGGKKDPLRDMFKKIFG